MHKNWTYKESLVDDPVVTCDKIEDTSETTSTRYPQRYQSDINNIHKDHKSLASLCFPVSCHVVTIVNSQLCSILHETKFSNLMLIIISNIVCLLLCDIINIKNIDPINVKVDKKITHNYSYLLRWLCETK